MNRRTIVNMLIMVILVLTAIINCEKKPTAPERDNPFDPKNINYDNIPPKIVLNVNTLNGISNETKFIFDASKSYENDDQSFSLAAKWDLDGDGNYDEELKKNNLIKHIIYDVGGGNKVIKLQVSGAKGITVDTSFTIFVNTRPQAAFTATQTAYYPLTMKFDASASTDYEDGHNLQYRWDFDSDGVFDTNWLTRDTISHVFDQYGTYQTQLSVRDQNKLIGQKTSEIQVQPPLVEMVFVQGGTFQMGDTWGDGDSNEQPVHTVMVSSFYLGKYEVTNAQVVDVFNWALGQGKITASSSTVQNAEGNRQELLDLNGDYCQINYNGSRLYVENNLDHYPVIEISWYGAAAFCNYLSEREGLTPVYDLSNWTANWNAIGYRLPTEAEWEYAAKGGANGNYTKYSGSDNVDDVAWYWDNSNANGNSNLYNGFGTLPIGTKQANELGIYDMSGNVWEWCWDWYGLYSSDSQTDPKGPYGGTFHVRRGGCWFNDAMYLRVSNRLGPGIVGSSYSVGFRLLRTY